MKAAGQYEPSISDNESGVTVLAKAAIEHASLQYQYTNSNPLTLMRGEALEAASRLQWGIDSPACCCSNSQRLP